MTKGRPKKVVDNTPKEEILPPVNMEIREIRVEVPVEKIVIQEVIRTVEIEKPQLEGFELYKKLRDTGFTQGGMGSWMEEANGIDKVYIPHAHEILAFFSGDPEKWEQMRDGIIRTYIEINGRNN